MFEIQWADVSQVQRTVQKEEAQEDLWLATAQQAHTRTIDTWRAPELKLRWLKLGEKLGAGKLGVVFKAINLDNGEFMAVKEFHHPIASAEVQSRLKKEVKILSSVKNVRQTKILQSFHRRTLTSSSSGS